MSACIGPAGEDGLQKKEVEEEVDLGVVEDTDLSGTTHTAGDDKARKKKRLDARRLKQTRPKTRTRSPEEIPVEEMSTKTVTRVGQLGCVSADPFMSLPELENGETTFLAHHCKSSAW